MKRPLLAALVFLIFIPSIVIAEGATSVFIDSLPIREVIYSIALLIATLVLTRYQIRELRRDNAEIRADNVALYNKHHDLDGGIHALGLKLAEHKHELEVSIHTLELKLVEYKKEIADSYVCKDEWVRTINKIDAKLDRMIERMNKYGG